MENVRLIPIKTICDPRGCLSVLEGSKDVPFEIQRIYYISRVPSDMKRGGHAHKNLEQVMICIHGTVTITVDNGTHCESYCLDDNSKGLYVSNMIWRAMLKFENDAVLLVLASKHYDEADYIRSYDEFLNLTGKESKRFEYIAKPS